MAVMGYFLNSLAIKKHFSNSFYFSLIAVFN